jgi:hypothetical protein
MTSRKQSVARVEAELAEGEKLVKREKKELKKAKGKLAKDNKRRALRVMEKAVDALARQKSLIEDGVPVPI